MMRDQQSIKLNLSCSVDNRDNSPCPENSGFAALGGVSQIRGNSLDTDIFMNVPESLTEGVAPLSMLQ